MNNADRHQEYADSVHRLFARVLYLPVYTVAAVQGHAFAAGAMFTLAHDARVLRADRGFWCLPEADINIPFPPATIPPLQARLTPADAHDPITPALHYAEQD